MAGARIIEAIGPSYYLRDRKSAAQRAVNWYMMQVEGLGEDAQVVLESAPGWLEVHDFGAEVRGAHNADGRPFIAAGDTLYEMSAAETMTTRGRIDVGVSVVSMANGLNQLAAVDGANLYVYNTDTGAFTRVTTEGWRGSKRVEFLDGYFIFVAPDTEQFYISAVDDATTLDAAEFSSADGQPDRVLAHIVTRGELRLFGTRTCEPWVNSGGIDFPFVRYQGTPVDVGIVGPHALTKAAGSVVWVGQTEKGGPYVYTFEGYDPRRISTQAVEQWLEASTDIASARMWSYQEAGAEFVILNAPGLETSWVWDAATRQWHERGEWVDGQWRPQRLEHAFYFQGFHYVAGGTKLYRMSREYSTLAGAPLVRERTWPHLVAPNLEPVTYRGLEVRCTTGEAVTGTMTLEVSNDGGQVFGPPLLRSLGVQGRRQQRVRWGPLGTCPGGGSRVFRLRCSDAVTLTLQAATIT